MGDVKYRIGMVITNPKKPEWGPGKILDITGRTITVYFRDDPEPPARTGVRTISLDYATPQVAPSQTDPQLDNLPPFEKGRLALSQRRHTLQSCIARFLSEYPKGFDDPHYVGKNRQEGERFYKWEAHGRWESKLGTGQGRHLLDEDEIDELARRTALVTAGLNLLSPFEQMALRDALQNHTAARRLFAALMDVLDAEQVTEAVFGPYLQAVNDLPVEEGKARVASWPVATLLPFLAQPGRFMFLKPSITCEFAEIVTFNLCYNAHPNWLTYEKLLGLAELLMAVLRPLGAEDMIDVQSFIWIVHSWSP
jgi:hypothetical protein